ncbi:cytochrome c [Aliishimia ponticola]|uniref:Cytochrome c n=1 Tax=Aliishimia ponticola TaxID=2499833 RepID=A0A4S4ND43_9RHOB|nr:c-type cytochrome [Aliishimia ponticola]THH37339.1 cytochrome c [Aliishimia ponticola]
MNRVLTAAAALAGLATFSACGLIQPETRQGAGGLAFQSNCAGCHGSDGRGGGTLFEPAPSITGLTQAEGGAFPAQYVVDVLEGHRRSDDFSAAMPDFGGQGMGSGRFVSVAGVDRPVPARTAGLLAYLESIQD